MPVRWTAWISIPILVTALLLAGCGAPAAPQPPTLNLPQPVRDLTAARIGDAVHVSFTVPQKTTDKLLMRGDMTAQLCRSVEGGLCRPAGILPLTNQKTASLDDTLPVDLTQGVPHLLTYRVSIQNHGGKSAGDSAAAYAAAGLATVPVADLKTTPRRDGIVLNWQGIAVPPNATDWVRFDRTRTAGPKVPVQPEGPGQRSPEEPADESLRVPETSADHRGMALDATARTGRSYRYTAQRVMQVRLAGHTLQLASVPTAPVEVTYRDIFPPAVPVGLLTAADTPGKAIDLSWTPDNDTGLAGYVVYRRAVTAGAGAPATPQRISPAGKPVTTPAWRDTTVAPGQRYAYSVSAIDTSGNESQRSAEAEDGLGASSVNPVPSHPASSRP